MVAVGGGDEGYRQARVVAGIFQQGSGQALGGQAQAFRQAPPHGVGPAQYLEGVQPEAPRFVLHADMINASQWDKKVRHKPTSAILWRLPAGRILRRVLQVTQVLYSPLHLG